MTASNRVYDVDQVYNDQSNIDILKRSRKRSIGRSLAAAEALTCLRWENAETLKPVIVKSKVA